MVKVLIVGLVGIKQGLWFGKGVVVSLEGNWREPIEGLKLVAELLRYSPVYLL